MTAFRLAPAYRRRGYTLVELLVVSTIVAVLAAVLFPVFAQGNARHSIDLSEFRQISVGASLYSEDYTDAPFCPPVLRRGAGHGGFSALAGGGNLTYHGGTVETAPKIYLILWGSQWNNNDPSGESAILQAFYKGVGGSAWNNSVTQYSGTTGYGGNQANMFAGFWADTTSNAPKHPTQSQLAAEAVKAAQHFGNLTAASNQDVQYVIATSHGNSASGFGTQYCAWHSSTTSGSLGQLSYTNLPYMTDAGASCGANFNGLGPKAGITIVAGHELAEAESDPFPSTGWVDSAGAENGDKCAWIATGQGATANVTFSTGTFPMQSLWSNAFNGGAGGCVLSYP